MGRASFELRSTARNALVLLQLSLNPVLASTGAGIGLICMRKPSLFRKHLIAFVIEEERRLLYYVANRGTSGGSGGGGSTDTASHILTESGSTLLTEGGDHLIME